MRFSIDWLVDGSSPEHSLFAGHSQQKRLIKMPGVNALLHVVAKKCHENSDTLLPMTMPGIGIWDWISNDDCEITPDQPDVIIACSGDVSTREFFAATAILCAGCSRI